MNVQTRESPGRRSNGAVCGWPSMAGQGSGMGIASPVGATKTEEEEVDVDVLFAAGD
jgi:hypothetical protein